MNGDAQQYSFGVFKPIGSVVISLPGIEHAHSALRALAEIGITTDDRGVDFLSDRQMLRQIDIDLASVSLLSGIGQEVNLVRAQRELAERGYYWLIVRARSDGRAHQIADRVKRCGAERAQYYGHFIIEELIEHAKDLPQVTESPDRGLDAQTRSGHEAERSKLRPGARAAKRA